MSDVRTRRRPVALAVLVAALGYFVDIYDLLLFSIVRIKSLQSLGLSGSALLEKGGQILSWQMAGMLVGGILWGVVGDKRGRLSVLFGSILLYSVANIANGFVHTVEAYRLVRLLAGVGLAGELGAGITLVSELMSKERRGYGTAIVATVGICGGIVAALVADLVTWRTAYFIGGGMGFGLLLLRLGVMESGLFEEVKLRAIERGQFFTLFTSPGRARRYISVILIGVPIWYVIGILITFAPELGQALGMKVSPSASRAVLFSYSGLAIGDIGSGLLSQALRSRKKVVTTFILMTALFIIGYFVIGPTSLSAFYVMCACLGVFTGYWAVFVTAASEQFGTNIRATVTTTAPNFVRGALVPINFVFQVAKAEVGVTTSALVVGGITILMSLAALSGFEETFGRDLNFDEE